jgi:hypothetical protein
MGMVKHKRPFSHTSAMVSSIKAWSVQEKNGLKDFVLVGRPNPWVGVGWPVAGGLSIYFDGNVDVVDIGVLKPMHCTSLLTLVFSFLSFSL